METGGARWERIPSQGNFQVQKAWGERELRTDTPGQRGERVHRRRPQGGEWGRDVSRQTLMAHGKESGIYSDVEGSQWMASSGRVSWADLCLIRSDKWLIGDQTSGVEEWKQRSLRRELHSQAWCSRGLSRAIQVPDSEHIMRAEPTGLGDG